MPPEDVPVFRCAQCGRTERSEGRDAAGVWVWPEGMTTSRINGEWVIHCASDVVGRIKLPDSPWLPLDREFMRGYHPPEVRA